MTYRISPQPTLGALGFDHVAEELRAELRRSLARTPSYAIHRLAWVVTEDGVEVVDRAELATRYRRHGLTPLTNKVKACRLDRACVVLEGEPETSVQALDVQRWLTEYRPKEKLL